MRIHLAADHRGYATAEVLREWLSATGHDVIWHAAPTLDPGDDYPEIVIRTMQAVVADEDAGREARAIIVGRAGEVVAANKVNGARVVSATAVGDIQDARAQADINGLVIAGAHVAASDVGPLVAALVDTAFSGDIDDARRLVNVAEFESSGTIEGWLIER